MMAKANPSVIGSAIAGWRDAVSMIGRMPHVAGIAFVLSLVVTVAGVPLMVAPGAPEPGLGGQLLGFLHGVAQGFLLTPLAIAVHRFVLLGEVTERYSLNPTDTRFLRFFGFTAALQILMLIPMPFMLAAGSLQGIALFAIGGIAAVLVIAVVIIIVRSVILFPAIAVDAPGATWLSAVRDSKGHFWRVFVIMIIAGLPIIPLQVLIYWTMLRPGAALASQTAGVVIEAAVNVIMIAAFAAVASRLYRAFAAQLGRPAGVDAQTSAA